MTVLSPQFVKTQTDPLLATLLEVAPNRPYVVAQLGQSLDGRIATVTGDSRWINRGAALDHLHRLRANVDAVVVGVGTVVEDDPELTVRRVAGQSPARVVIDPNGRVPEGARCLRDTGVRRIVIRRRTAAEPRTGVEEFVVPGETLLDPHQIIAALFSAGLRKILIEGGAATISSFIDAGAVDRLHVLVAPVILGSGVASLRLAPIDAIAQARRPVTSVHVLDDGDVLFDCDLRRNEQG